MTASAPRTRAALCIAAATLALTGCPEVDTGPEAKATATVDTLLQACARGSGEAALGLLTPPAKDTLIGAESVFAGCDEVLALGAESELDARRFFAEATVEHVRVGDGFGTATIRVPTGDTSEVELENVGDQWLVSNPSV